MKYALVALAAGASVAQAADVSMIPADAGWFIVGEAQTSHELPRGGGARSYEVSTKGGNPWEAGALSGMAGAVKAGDTILVTVPIAAKTDAGGPGKVVIRVETRAAPYTTIGETTVAPGAERKDYVLSFKATKGWPADTLQATLHLNSVRQTVTIGAPTVVDKGQ